MPYVTNKELPSFMKKYSTKIQSQWRHVFNTVYTKTNSDIRALKAANSILKKRFEKTNCMSNNGRDDYFNMLTDNFLGNLKSN